MASREETVQRLAEKLKDAGAVTYRKMFGEYGLYLDGKFFATVEDDRFCLKMTEAGGAYLGTPEIISPHEGAYYFYVPESLDAAFLCELARITCRALPDKKRKKEKLN